MTNITVLLVHGVGDPIPGAIAEEAVDIIKNRFQARVVEKQSAPRAGAPGADVNNTTDAFDVQMRSRSLAIDEHQINITEFHWSRAAGRISWKTPLPACLRIAETLGEIPIMTVSRSTPAWLQRILKIYGGVLTWSFIIATFLSLLMSVELFAKKPIPAALLTTSAASKAPDLLPFEICIFVFNGCKFDAAFTNYIDQCAKEGFYSIGLMFIFIAIIFYFLFATYLIGIFLLVAAPIVWIVKRGKSEFGALSKVVIVSTLIHMASMALFYLYGSAFLPTVVLKMSGAGAAFAAVVFLLIAAIVTMPLLIFIQMARDVTHYLAMTSVVNGGGAAFNATNRLRRYLEQACDDKNNSRVVLVSHSLGTVITTDALQAFAASRSTPAVPILLITAGSPLRRLLHRFIPNRFAHPADIYQSIRANPNIQFAWVNAYRPFDYIGQNLSYSFWLPLRFIYKLSAEKPRINERLLQPAIHWRLFHANYWNDPRFLNIIVDHMTNNTKTNE